MELRAYHGDAGIIPSPSQVNQGADWPKRDPLSAPSFMSDLSSGKRVFKDLRPT